MSERGIIAIDAMGADRGPNVPVEAALTVARRGRPIALVGDRAVLERALADLGGPIPKNLELVHAPEVVAMGEKPSAAVRRKRDASISVAMRLVAEKKASAMVSAGNSGAALAAAVFELGRVAGVQRPAIASAFPTKKDPAVVLDLGANIDPTPVQLAQFAVLGETYARVVLHRARPKVALLANGSEEVKGTEVTRAAHELLARSTLDYVGYCEGRDLFSGDLDVVVTDGFTGNVVLKSLEGLVMALREIFEREIRSSITATAGALLMRKIFGTVKRKLDYEEAGGAPLLGVNGLALVAHGASTTNALVHAIGAAEHLAGTGLVAAIEESIAKNGDLWTPPTRGSAA